MKLNLRPVSMAGMGPQREPPSQGLVGPSPAVSWQTQPVGRSGHYLAQGALQLQPSLHILLRQPPELQAPYMSQAGPGSQVQMHGGLGAA